MINDFVAFDFETASGKNPCSIGIVHYQKGIIVNEYYSLINPEIKFNPFTVRVHGINERDVRNERKFHELWLDIEHFFSNPFVVAHNSAFDDAVLKYMLNKNNFTIPSFECLCTLKLARRLINSHNYKLSTLAKVLGINQEHYHNALDDAKVCGELFLKLLDLENNLENIREICNSASERQKKQPSRTSFKSVALHSGLEKNSCKLENLKIVVSGKFYNFSREEIQDFIANHGGRVMTSISSKTSYVVAGENMGPSKLAKAEGLGIPIISEDDFLGMVE